MCIFANAILKDFESTITHEIYFLIPIVIGFILETPYIAEKL